MLAYTEVMPTLTINGITIEAADVSLKDARNAVYLVRHIESGRVYVGITKGSVADRWKQHLYSATNKSRVWYFAQALRCYGPEAFEVNVLCCDLPRDCLIAEERRLIALFSSNATGYGFNISSGGDGIEMTEAVAKRISATLSGRKKTAEHISRVAEANRGQKRSPEIKRKFSEIFKGREISQEARIKIGLAHRGMKRPPETGQRISTALTGQKFSDERRLQMSGIAREAMMRPEVRARSSAAHTGKVQSSETRAKMAESQRRRRALEAQLRAENSSCC